MSNSSQLDCESDTCYFLFRFPSFATPTTRSLEGCWCVLIICILHIFIMVLSCTIPREEEKNYYFSMKKNHWYESNKKRTTMQDREQDPGNYGTIVEFQLVTERILLVYYDKRREINDKIVCWGWEMGICLQVCNILEVHISVSQENVSEFQHVSCAGRREIENHPKQRRWWENMQNECSNTESTCHDNLA